MIQYFLNGVIVFSFLFSGNSHGQRIKPDSLNKKRLFTVIGAEAGIYTTGLSFLAFIWYKDHERVPFHWYDDSKGYLQMDKAGHAYGAYWESRAAYHALRWAGVNHKKALMFGGPAGLIFQTPIEIFDGLYEGWGFSWPDMAANSLGAAIFTAQQAIWDDQRITMKFTYSPSIYPSYHSILGESYMESFFLDYNAHTYWLSANLKSLSGINGLPPWLNIALGYSANGMIYEYRNPVWYNGKPFPHLDRYRQYLLSLDVDFTKIPTRRKWLRQVYGFLNLIKIPFPTLEYNRIDGFRLRPFYF